MNEIEMQKQSRMLRDAGKSPGEIALELRDGLGLTAGEVAQVLRHGLNLTAERVEQIMQDAGKSPAEIAQKLLALGLTAEQIEQAILIWIANIVTREFVITAIGPSTGD